jgi:hypothetical protein
MRRRNGHFPSADAQDFPYGQVWRSADMHVYFLVVPSTAPQKTPKEISGGRMAMGWGGGFWPCACGRAACDLVRGNPDLRTMATPPPTSGAGGCARRFARRRALTAPPFDTERSIGVPGTISARLSEDWMACKAASSAARGAMWISTSCPLLVFEPTSVTLRLRMRGHRPTPARPVFNGLPASEGANPPRVAHGTLPTDYATLLD